MPPPHEISKAAAGEGGGWTTFGHSLIFSGISKRIVFLFSKAINKNTGLPIYIVVGLRISELVQEDEEAAVLRMLVALAMMVMLLLMLVPSSWLLLLVAGICSYGGGQTDRQTRQQEMLSFDIDDIATVEDI